MSIINNAKDILASIENQKVIFIDILQTDCDVVISIQDNGGGVDEKILDKIFEIYYTTKHKSVGTGKGLYSAYNIVKYYLKGNINVENKIFEYENKTYKGAKFDIVLPINIYLKA